MSRRTSFLGLGNEYCASAVGEDPGSEVQAERRSIYTLAYLQLPGDPSSPSSKKIRKGHPFQGPRVSSYLKLGNEFSEEVHVLTKQETLLGKGSLDGQQQDKGAQEHGSAAWLTVSGFR